MCKELCNIYNSECINLHCWTQKYIFFLWQKRTSRLQTVTRFVSRIYSIFCQRHLHRHRMQGAVIAETDW